MAYQEAYDYLNGKGFADRIRLFDVSSATVALAAKALGCEECRIAKTLAFDQDGRTVLILAAGDVKVDNHKYKEAFHMKAKMLSHDETAERVGHPVGGVCPFGVKDGVEVFLDESLRRFDIVYPAAGTPSSAVEVHADEFGTLLPHARWIDITKPMVVEG